MMNRQALPNNASDRPKILCPDLVPVKEQYRNKWFKVLERGGIFTFEYDRPQVVVLPIVDKKSIVMVRVRRPLMDDSPLELPAGDSLEQETPAEAASREFSEETGICVNSLERFKPATAISEMPGRMPVLLSVFYIELGMDEFLKRRAFDKKEIISVELLSIGAVINKIITGEIYLSSPIAILSRFIFSNLDGIK
ncbi:MAG: NUDIX hydrolase [Candidatus Omnitrophota bacterium]